MSIFDSVQTPNPGYNKFDLSYTNTLTTKMGQITPVYMEHLVPGDKFRIKSNVFARLMPMATPAFGNLRIIMRYFFVPYRLLFYHQDETAGSFQAFITGGTLDGSDSLPTPTEAPYINLNGYQTPAKFFTPGTLGDYLGCNIGDVSNIPNNAPDFNFSALPFLAYHRIYNDWYRDENIDKPVDIKNICYPAKITTPDKINKISVLHNARWHKDYFTSALISPTMGAEQMLPLVGGDLSVLGNFATDLYKPDSGYAPVSISSDGNFYAEYNGQQNGPLNSSGTEGALYADGSDQYMASIRDLRNSIATQRFLEISARGGNRYIEQIFAHFGVRSLDARLQRAEFLGGGITPVNVGEVLQTSETSVTPLGEMGGRGVAYGTDNSCTHYASEHGILMGLMTIQPEAQYFQGMSKHWFKFDRLDYYWPSFAHIGDQDIKNYEIYNDITDADNEGLFGYAPRYAEYKHHNNEIHGKIKTDMIDWTFAQKYGSRPNLNSTFIEVPKINSPFADTTNNDKFIIHISHKVDALRKMPYYGNPSLIG